MLKAKNNNVVLKNPNQAIVHDCKGRIAPQSGLCTKADRSRQVCHKRQRIQFSPVNGILRCGYIGLTDH
jgi:hypothetical protein